MKMITTRIIMMIKYYKIRHQMITGCQKIIKHLRIIIYQKIIKYQKIIIYQKIETY